jgi:hypothetical protein
MIKISSNTAHRPSAANMAQRSGILSVLNPAVHHHHVDVATNQSGGSHALVKTPSCFTQFLANTMSVT